MLSLTFLGTGGSTPTKARGMPAVAIESEGSILLFDCGEGTQRQAMQTSVNISKIKAIFITHTHGDHIIGLAGLVRTMALNKRPAPLHIFVPRGEEGKINTLLTFDKALIEYPIIVKGIGAGEIYSEDDFGVTAFKLNHNVPAYGYVFKQDDKMRFFKEKCQKLGIKGTLFSEITEKGWIKVGAKRIMLKDVTFTVPGVKIVYATDTRPVASTVNAAKGADLLIHEASYAQDLVGLAKDRYHSTAVEAAGVAKKAGCKRLMLFHLSARYKTGEPLLNEARAVFKNSEVAEDGIRIVFGGS